MKLYDNKYPISENAEYVVDYKIERRRARYFLGNG